MTKRWWGGFYGGWYWPYGGGYYYGKRSDGPAVEMRREVMDQRSWENVEKRSGRNGYSTNGYGGYWRGGYTYAHATHLRRNAPRYSHYERSQF